MSFWRLEQYDRLDSTSNLCIARAKADEPAGLVVIAAQQTAGRGSRGRHWLSEPGNLALSLLLRPAESRQSTSVFPLLAGLAVAEAAAGFLASQAVQPMLKWPNDVLLGDAKFAGILLDAAIADARLDWLVIGIGVNLAYAPAIAGRDTICIAAHGVTVTPDYFAEQLLGRFSYWLEIFATQGAPAIHQAWLASAHPIGTALEVNAGETRVSGRFAGLSPAGTLLLQVEDRIEEFHTGEIILSTGS